MFNCIWVKILIMDSPHSFSTLLHVVNVVPVVQEKKKNTYLYFFMPNNKM